jgi:SulP family sulfate permease
VLDIFLKDARRRGLTVLLAGVRPPLLDALTQIGITERHAIDHIFIEETEDYSATLKAIRHAYALAAIEAISAGRTEDWQELSATKLAYYLV